MKQNFSKQIISYISAFLLPDKDGLHDGSPIDGTLDMRRLEATDLSHYLP